MVNDSADVTSSSSGRSFHVCGPAIGKDRLPTVDKRRLNQGSFVLLCFALFAFSQLCLVSVLCVFFCLLSCIFQNIQREWHCIVPLSASLT